MRTVAPLPPADDVCIPTLTSFALLRSLRSLTSDIAHRFARSLPMIAHGRSAPSDRGSITLASLAPCR